MTSFKKDYRKQCTLCGIPRNVLVRCQIDQSAKWHFVCPGACWRAVSGGEVDGDQALEHRFYRYGGMWKNKHEAVSAKMPKTRKKPRKGMAETETKPQSADEHPSRDACHSR